MNQPHKQLKLNEIRSSFWSGYRDKDLIMSIGLIGTKLGMTREFLETGQSVPVTVIKIEKGRVLDVILKEKRGYNAVKIGFFKLKNSKLTKQMKGYFAKKNTEPKKILKEYRVENNAVYKEGTR